MVSKLFNVLNILDQMSLNLYLFITEILNSILFSDLLPRKLTMRMSHTNVIFGSYGFTLKQTNNAEMQNMLEKFAILDP